jgi:hypothetical protein
MPVVGPLAYNEIGTPSTSDSRRCRFLTRPAERAGPVPGHLHRHLPGGLGQHRLGAATVADVPATALPRRMVLVVAWGAPSGEVLGHLLPRKRGHPHSSADSSTVAVIVFNNPSGPVKSSPRARAP